MNALRLARKRFRPPCLEGGSDGRVQRQASSVFPRRYNRDASLPADLLQPRRRLGPTTVTTEVVADHIRLTPGVRSTLRGDSSKP
jgi:hypothetical protein